MTTWLKTNRGFLVFLLCFGFFRTAVADWNPVPSGAATLVSPTFSAARFRWVWAVAGVQAILIALLLYETLSDAALYVGT